MAGNTLMGDLAAMAFAALGDSRRAWELLTMINL